MQATDCIDDIDLEHAFCKRELGPYDAATNRPKKSTRRQLPPGLRFEMLDSETWLVFLPGGMLYTSGLLSFRDFLRCGESEFHVIPIL